MNQWGSTFYETYILCSSHRGLCPIHMNRQKDAMMLPDDSGSIALADIFLGQTAQTPAHLCESTTYVPDGVWKAMPGSNAAA